MAKDYRESAPCGQVRGAKAIEATARRGYSDLHHSHAAEAAMITLEHGPNFISAAVFGEFTVADYNEFKELASYKIRFEGPIRLLIDLRQMLGYTVDVA